MANNTIQLKRSSVAGKTPNTSTLATGELAINLTDKKLYSSDGSNIFEPAGNVTDINITGGIKANGSFGTNGYTLSTNGSGIYWSPAGAGSTTNTTPSNIKNIVNTSVNTIASVIDTANATGISTIEYLISARDNINSNYKSARILITTDGTTAFITEYGIVLSNNSAQVCSFDSDINAGNIRLIVTGDSVDTDVSLQRVVLGSATEAGDIAASIILDSVTNTAINISAAANSVKLAYDTAIAAYSNSVSYTDTKIGTANTAITSNAATAYTNATIFAANISNVNSGTLSEARLPYRMNQNVRTTDNVQFNDLTVAGNLTISGNTLIVGANNLIVSDAVISLHTPANLAALTSNDGRNIGLAFHYYDTEDKHALLYRDNTTGYLQYHTDGADPISNSNPTGNNFGTIQAATFWAGNSSIYATVNATNYTGTSNNASNLGGQLPAYYTNATNITTGTLPYAQIPGNVINTTANFTRTGITTFSANIILGTSGVSSNGSFGTTGQVLTSNGSSVYWSTVAGGGFTNGQSISVNNFVVAGAVTANGSNGTSGQILASNGTAIYWANASAGVSAIPSNIRNIVNTSVNTIASVIDTISVTGISTIEYVVSARDNINSNFKSSRILIISDGTTPYIMEYAYVSSNDTVDVCTFDSDINAGNIRLLATGDSVDVDVSLQRVVLGSSTEAGDIAASVIVDSVTNTAINVSAAANSVKLAYDTAITAYTNAVSYVDTKIGTANTAMAANAATAYSNAVSYVDTANFTRTGITTFSANVVLGSSGLSSNGSFGTTGQILASNGTATYWASTIAPRVNTATSTATLAWNSDNYEQYQLTALATICTISADSGTPINGRKIIFRLEDNGTARALTWTNGVSNSFRAIGTTLPTATVANKTVYVGAIYNSTDSRWDVIAVAQEA
jgi:hypothetical protein